MLAPLDGPAIQGKLTVTDAAVVEAKVGATSFDERKVITLEGSGKFYVYFANEGEIPTPAQVADRGFLHYANCKESYEACDTQLVYMLAVSGSVDVKLAERA